MHKPSTLSSSLLVSAALLVAVALALTLGVIPRVKGDAFPGATPERAVPVLWGLSACQIVAALALALLASQPVPHGVAWRFLTGFLGVLVLLWGCALLDGAFAYWGHGPFMHLPAVLLFACTAASLVASILVLIRAFSRRGASALAS